mmetsp:Transcript_61075/g.144100  ORF Transcript_61075/g.144100 Transcript_61075/m.144100 type:complete len:373 (+) Transcript_61075:382-1500(+)
MMIASASRLSTALLNDDISPCAEDVPSCTFRRSTALPGLSSGSASMTCVSISSSLLPSPRNEFWIFWAMFCSTERQRSSRSGSNCGMPAKRLKKSEGGWNWYCSTAKALNFSIDSPTACCSFSLTWSLTEGCCADSCSPSRLSSTGHDCSMFVIVATAFGNCSVLSSWSTSCCEANTFSSSCVLTNPPLPPPISRSYSFCTSGRATPDWITEAALDRALSSFAMASRSETDSSLESSRTFLATASMESSILFESSALTCHGTLALRFSFSSSSSTATKLDSSIFCRMSCTTSDTRCFRLSSYCWNSAVNFFASSSIASSSTHSRRTTCSSSSDLFASLLFSVKPRSRFPYTSDSFCSARARKSDPARRYRLG